MPLLFFPFLSSLKSAFHSRSEYRQLHSKLKKLFALSSSPFHHTPFCTIFCHLYRSQREGKKIHFVLCLIPSREIICWCASTEWGAACLPVLLNVTEIKAMFRVGLSWSKCVALLASHHSVWQRNWAAWDLQWTLAGKFFRKEKWIFRLFLAPRAWLHYSLLTMTPLSVNSLFSLLCPGDLWHESAFLICCLMCYVLLRPLWQTASPWITTTSSVAALMALCGFLTLWTFTLSLLCPSHTSWELTSQVWLRPGTVEKGGREQGRLVGVRTVP